MPKGTPPLPEGVVPVPGRMEFATRMNILMGISQDYVSKRMGKLEPSEFKKTCKRGLHLANEFLEQLDREGTRLGLLEVAFWDKLREGMEARGNASDEPQIIVPFPGMTDKVIEVDPKTGAPVS